VNAGAQYGAAGAIERIVKELAVWRRSDGAHDPVVMLCGGDAERLSALLAIEHRVEADLVFGGLSVVLS
jgi:pantothenate kinase type III